MIERLDHVAIAVSDLDRSVAFYSHHFGLNPYFVQSGRVGPLRAIAYLRSQQGVLELMHAPEGALTRAQREMIAVVVSAANGCHY